MEAYASFAAAFASFISMIADLVSRMRRPRVPWMTRSDDAILEFLYNDPGHEIRATPVTIGANIEFSHSTVLKRVRLLETAGLLRYHDEDRGIYELTDLGRRYLTGEADHDDLLPAPDRDS